MRDLNVMYEAGVVEYFKKAFKTVKIDDEICKELIRMFILAHPTTTFCVQYEAPLKKYLLDILKT